MKWAALLFFLLVAVGLTHALRRDPRAALIAAFMLGFLPFVMGPWHLIVAPYGFPGWPGYVKGWEVGLIDAIAISCLITLPRARTSLPFRYVFLLYIAVAVFSVFFAPNLTIAIAYPIQLARIFIILAAVARLASSPSGLKATFQGLVMGLAYQALAAIWARFGGAMQTGGSFGHQNLLGYVSHLVLIPAFALLLAGQWTRWAVIGLVSGVTVVILTVSRATIAFAATGLIVTYLISAMSHWSNRKGVVGLALLALIGLSYPMVHSAFEQRFETQGGGGFTTQDGEREAFARAARMMSADHPFGVGANHYVMVANTQGYSQRAGVTWSSGSRSTNVHNSYLLIQAETGLLGLLSIILLLGVTTVGSLVQGLKHRRVAQAQLLIGIAGALFAVILHSFYEWMLVTYQAQYVLAVSVGMAAGLIRQLRATDAIGSSTFRVAKIERNRRLHSAETLAMRQSPQ